MGRESKPQTRKHWSEPRRPRLKSHTKKSLLANTAPTHRASGVGGTQKNHHRFNVYGVGGLLKTSIGSQSSLRITAMEECAQTGFAASAAHLCRGPWSSLPLVGCLSAACGARGQFWEMTSGTCFRVQSIASFVWIRVLASVYGGVELFTPVSVTVNPDLEVTLVCLYGDPEQKELCNKLHRLECG